MLQGKPDITTKGWIAGDFFGAVLRTSSAEFGVKTYKAGMVEPKHIHLFTTEITYIAEGEALIEVNTLDNVRVCKVFKGEYFIIYPGEACEFEAIKDTTTVVFKTPSLPGDKKLCG